MSSNNKFQDSFTITLDHLTTLLLEAWAEGSVLKTEGTILDKMGAGALQKVAKELLAWRSGELLTVDTLVKLEELGAWQRGEKARLLDPDDVTELQEWRSGKRLSPGRVQLVQAISEGLADTVAGWAEDGDQVLAEVWGEVRSGVIDLPVA